LCAFFKEQVRMPFHELNTQDVVLLRHRIPSQLEALSALADAVDHALAPWPHLAFSVNLCLDELITNTILHGLSGSPDHWIDIEIKHKDQKIQIVIQDDAPFFDPFLQAPEPNLDLDVATRPIGGLGVYLVKQTMDHAQALPYLPNRSGNRIVLEKKIDCPLP
jgi:serine/threonine-protein kinase RsbW